MFNPNFAITPAIANSLMQIEACRQAVSTLPVTLTVLNSLRESARLAATHYSTQIEGNRLTQEQVGAVVLGGTFPNRARDEAEVKNYYAALAYLDDLVAQPDTAFDLGTIQMIHGLVMTGRAKATPWRDGQNVIRNASDGAIVYMPPEAKDVANLMGELEYWLNAETHYPAPIFAAIAHYQFASIHPYYDGNGRTARLLTNLLLHRSGFGLKGIFSLEEYYARDLQSYYRALSVGPSHNYYMGRAEADITDWVAYFCAGMADAFARVRRQAQNAVPVAGQSDQTHLLRQLDARQRRTLTLFQQHAQITTRQIADLLGIHPRSALNLCRKWVSEGFLSQHGESKKLRHYSLGEAWITLIG